MPTREELNEAYSAFRLPVGSDWRSIKKRYKLLVKAWHPDKQGGGVKEEVEQELKEYNNYYNDVFKRHFESEHSDGLDCVCQPVQDVRQESAQEQFQEAENQTQYSEPAEQIDPEVEALSQKRRWQASGLCAIVFIAILAYGFIGSKIKSIVPVQKAAVQNMQSEQSSTAPPAANDKDWRAPYQSISTPITQQQLQSRPSQTIRNTDEIRREIVSKETKIQMLQQGIDTLKAQIKVAQPASAGMLYQELGNKEAQMRDLQQDVYSLGHSIGEN